MNETRLQSIGARLWGLFKKESFPLFVRMRAFLLSFCRKCLTLYPEEVFLSTIAVLAIGFYFLHTDTFDQKNLTTELVQSVFAYDSNDTSEQSAFLGTASPLNPEYYDSSGEDDSALQTEIIDDALKANTAPVMATTDKDGVKVYTVRKGDTIAEIATYFGVSADTIVWENNLARRQKLQQGQHLTILPVSGVRHEVAKGETLESIATQFGVEVGEIITYNKLMHGTIKEGDVLILPDGTMPYVKQNISSSKNLVNIRGYFGAPTVGYNQGVLHATNAVDIANACGTNVVAAAEGLVVEAKSGWNGGYGNYIKIEHPNGVFTKYAHLASLVAGYGDYVAKGQVVGLMGNTGKATGCHLHFEVLGAKNPFTK
ncbi:MAG: peptidoglycan DD-metalloendopeptidase family protein [Parcubacteria group bacterium]|nr:peptidoglycan DD-metalloendopeptidase family protein [Parcubacteria group bacterium]